MTYNEFKVKRLGKWYQETAELWRQCVAGCKNYIKELYGITQWSWWGSAYTWRQNKTNAFPDTQRKTTLYKAWMIAPQWAIVFFKPDASNGNCGHVAIVDSWTQTGMKILEQNGGGKGNHASWDEYTIRWRSYTTCLWRKTLIPKYTIEQQKIIKDCLASNSAMWSFTTNPEIRWLLEDTNNKIRSFYPL